MDLELPTKTDLSTEFEVCANLAGCQLIAFGLPEDPAYLVCRLVELLSV